MRRPGRALVLALALGAWLPAGGAFAESSGEWGSPEQLWRATCRYCHDNGIAPELRGAGLQPQAIVTAVRVGPKAMPSFTQSQISDRELDQLAAWVTMQKAPAPPAVDRSTRESRHSSRDRAR